MEQYKELKKISGDSVLVESIDQSQPTICKTIGGATYVARMNFSSVSKMKVEEKLIRLMGEEIKKEM